MDMVSKRNLWPKLLISKEQNVKRIAGKQFLYHVRNPEYGQLALCGIRLERRVTYVEVHKAKGAALLCANCRRRSFGETGKGRSKSLLHL